MALAAPTKTKKSKSDKEITSKKAPLTKGMQAKERIISVAETLFTKQGFDGASMRDIAAAAKMQPASMYYHFDSKEELLWAVWEKGGLELLNRVNDAIALKTDPWQRMEIACVAHISGCLPGTTRIASRRVSFRCGTITKKSSLALSTTCRFVAASIAATCG
jgi:TetR/AcrR family transcriptional regulator, cholesterol catabolism regulator